MLFIGLYGRLKFFILKQNWWTNFLEQKQVKQLIWGQLRNLTTNLLNLDKKIISLFTGHCKLNLYMLYYWVSRRCNVQILARKKNGRAHSVLLRRPGQAKVSINRREKAYGELHQEAAQSWEFNYKDKADNALKQKTDFTKDSLGSQWKWFNYHVP